MIYILLLIISNRTYDGTAITQIEFKTKDECVNNGKRITAELGISIRTHFICIEKRKGE